MELTALAACAAEAASAALARSMGVSSAMAFVRGRDGDVENASALSCLLQGGESRTAIRCLINLARVPRLQPLDLSPPRSVAPLAASAHMPPRQRAAKSPTRAARPPASPAPRVKGAAAAPAGVSWNAQQTPLGVALNNYLAPLLTMLVTPYLAYVVTYITSLPTPTIGAFLERCAARGVHGIHADILAELEPTAEAATLLLVFNFVALLIYWWPGPTEHGPVTIHGHTPEYSDNGVAHCVLFTLRYPNPGPNPNPSPGPGPNPGPRPRP